ncbi:MAG: carbohydrate ABC transporter permease [Lachnospiraceae bacterium]|jgi:ABC-type glycerol-3-phosphate transport system permease component|nr:carbohydrate ABC transporter permease [Lachnospiraceae bacterium]MCI1424008.1 carbohydrate ABC transporter permease [Lachnospiraceae bacterium]MCI1452807.1 carbohydrate ABC transporter permease [Lachnospiraceae bacterium]MDD5848928.1 carbohydrate ABC transporter permease [Bacillota bacterium]
MEMKKKNGMQALIYVLLILGMVIVILPMLYMVSTSLKPNGALYEYPPQFFPKLHEITLENYKYILSQRKFLGNFLNSIAVSVCTVAISAAVSSALAFCIARFRFPGRRALFAFIILTMIIPGTTMIVPQYELAVKLKTINSIWGLIPFYVAWVIPYSTFMIKGFVEGVPSELDEATYMDGGNVFTVYVHVIIPLTKPGIASISIFNFLTAWEEFPWANTVINDDLKRTLPIAISGFFGQHQFTQWGYVFALSVLSLIPILIVFISCQKFFVQGLTAGSVKG